MATDIAKLRKPDHVMGRAFDPLVRLADERGWDQTELLEGLGVTESEIRDGRAKIPWDTFSRYAERFEAKLGGPGEIKQLADVLVPTFAHLVKFIGFFASPEAIYGVINRWGGPSIFPPITHTSRRLDGDRLEVTLTIPQELRPSPTFLRITEMMFHTAPCLVGGDPTLVETTIDGHQGTFVIHLPPSSTLWARVKRAFRAFFSGAVVLDELANQHDRLLESHRNLRTTHSELQRSEENFRSLIEQAPLGVFVVADDVVLYANQGASQFLRFPPKASLESRRFTSFLVGDEAPGLRAGNDADHPTTQMSFMADDGETVVGETNRIPVAWNGRDAKLVLVVDVTERDRVMTRALQLDRMIAIGTLAAGVAHEINNPLAYVHSNLEYAIEGLRELEEKIAEPHDARLGGLREALEESLDGTTRTRAIVRDMKSFSREPGETRVAVDVRDVVRSAINMGWHEVRTKARLRTEYDDVPDVLADAGRLVQVVLNLVVNAAQALDAGEKERNFITIRTRGEEQRGIIEVEDNGPGIPPADLRRIFDPFFTTKPLGEGTGLGLWISSNIVARFGGELTVESEVGRGTVFRISLPFALAEDAEGPPELDVTSESEDDDEGAPAREPRVTPGFFRRADVRVMVIDDEELIVRLVERVLNDEVIGFTDPHEAFRHLREDRDFDVILCDATMPGINGREFLVRLRAEYPQLAKRFVLVTGGLRPSWENFEEMPEIMSKPFDMAKLRKVVSRVASSSDRPTIH